MTTQTPFPPQRPLPAPGEITGNLHPHGKRFETHQVRRIPLITEPEAEDAINASSGQGRLFPLALSEAFGQYPQVAALHLRVLTFAADADAGGPLLCLTIIHAWEQHAPPHALLHPHVLLIDATDLARVHRSGHPAFHAAEGAAELARIYGEQEQGRRRRAHWERQRRLVHRGQ